jgi:hypothetical protein
MFTRLRSCGFLSSFGTPRRNGKKTSQIITPTTCGTAGCSLWKNTAINDGWDIDELLQLDKTKF